MKFQTYYISFLLMPLLLFGCSFIPSNADLYKNSYFKESYGVGILCSSKENSKVEEEYYKIWRRGLLREKEKKYETAISLYNKAYDLDISLSERYNVLLSLGRAYLLNGEKEKSDEVLSQYIEFVQNDKTRGKDLESMTDKEGYVYALKDIALAKWLLGLDKLEVQWKTYTINK